MLVTTTLKPMITTASTMKTSKLDPFDQTKAEKHQRKTKIQKANPKKDKKKRAKTRKARINPKRRKKVEIDEGKKIKSLNHDIYNNLDYIYTK